MTDYDVRQLREARDRLNVACKQAEFALRDVGLVDAELRAAAALRFAQEAERKLGLFVRRQERRRS